MTVEDWQYGGFGLYVHWPFCEAKCPYCDFNSHVTRQVDHGAWAEALVAELDRVADLSPGRVLRSIFFGGGTPSLMAVETVSAIIEQACKRWRPANDIEITLEANPRSVEADKFRGFRDAGVNRVSLGIQSLHDDDLKRLGRLHSASEARAAFDVARSVFDRVSFDLIYARQGQTLEAWRTELRDALSMAADHLSLYQLTIEPGTAFWERAERGGLRGLPDEDLAADMYELTQELTDIAGMPAYEVSNHAVPGAESRHNLIYWMGGDYAGIGPGAHGRLTLSGQCHVTEGWLSPARWLTEAQSGSGDRVFQPINIQDRVGELIMMGLRINDGLDMDRFDRMIPGLLNSVAVHDLVDEGFLMVDNNRLKATARGRLVLNSVVARLLPDD
ncbi:radical SAM family heme chaperone HemW [Cognatishimia sp. F0-27]|uniref:radical SAM family heme chaperone HemW n=1 Tax=Cognatishimia sp. F0-27 TaxID=2816855 RepID=UPI001D0C2723|nr:radical SAM family heme chaperone HemW [Cognatishimia sp. F0-27]MCC1492457.1 coproporphyrinogen III oxidase [Cognatishimia sp. F0-27]